ncbi:universal stress protein [Variovorax dokdonensis]|uniref:Universal stress protein n=1 Tax=Variovorax dokdonensis TaxID=344883 RepID=A0ABT7N8G6_9BURK|nr:universal stress protein [Variovorax dokdonensis]MDM0044236.1 universal stress protein [Variovorax dokdonensis]
MKIILAVDGSAYTAKALDYVATNRAMFVDGHELIAVHVCTGIPGHVTRHVSKDVVDDYYRDEQDKVLGPVKEKLAALAISNYRIDARHGHAAKEIIASATQNGAGLIVMGTHGHGIFGRALMGSVATKVVAESDTAVLLVR